MVEFKELKLSDRGWIQEILDKCNYMSCEYSFGNYYIWKRIYDIKVASINGFYTAWLTQNNEASFLFPAGEGDIKPVIEELLHFCNTSGIPFKLHSMPEERKGELEALFPNKFLIEDERDFSDYIYKSEDLINLSGKKYHGKRNHIARFKENNWVFEPITKSNMEDCLQMNSIWCAKNDCAANPQKRDEFCAAQRCFRYFDELHLFGGLLRVDGNVVAYTVGERLNNNTAVVHIEKAFAEINGAYPAINREFVANMASEYEYINREEDLGVEGLRKAKLSYNPAIILKKYGVFER